MDRPLSNTSPKSVLDNHCKSPYASNNHSHNIGIISPESFDRSKYKVGGVNFSPAAIRECINSHRLEVQSNADVTPMRQDRCEATCSKDDQIRVFAKPLSRPSYPSEGKTAFDIDNVFTPSTPPRSPGIDVSDDNDSGNLTMPILSQNYCVFFFSF